METQSKGRLVGGWQYVGPEEEFGEWCSRLHLLNDAVKSLREAGYYELARRVEREWNEERNRYYVKLDDVGSTKHD